MNLRESEAKRRVRGPDRQPRAGRTTNDDGLLVVLRDMCSRDRICDVAERLKVSENCLRRTMRSGIFDKSIRAHLIGMLATEGSVSDFLVAGTDRTFPGEDVLSHETQDANDHSCGSAGTPTSRGNYRTGSLGDHPEDLESAA